MNEQSKVRARPAAIRLTPAAEARIAELMSRAPDGAIGVKLSTPRRGVDNLTPIAPSGALAISSAMRASAAGVSVIAAGRARTLVSLFI